MTQRAAISQAGANGYVGIQIAYAVALICTLSLGTGELALEQLAPSPDCAERVAIDVEYRRTRRSYIPPAGADLIAQRLVYAGGGVVSGLRVVRHLGESSSPQ